ncbi:hypothetical protein BOTBODRAFT_181764, partial [Botryobasidium botryosum FD-172 SS1]
MNFLQFAGTELQARTNIWFENLLRETANRDERQACEALGYLLYAGSPADAWYEGLPDTIWLCWPSLTAAFHATWPVSPKLLNASRALHAKRMEREEDMARAKLEEMVLVARRAVEAAREREDYMWWGYLEEKNRLAFEARCEAAFDEDWAEFEEWERSAQAAREEDERVQREYEAQEIAREEDLAWQAQEEQLDEDWRARVAVIKAEGRRAAVELGIARVLRVKEVLRAEAEVEDRRRRRQEATRQRTTARCVRHPLYTTPTTLATLSAPPNTTVVAYPVVLETIVADVLEPTMKKPPDGPGLESFIASVSQELAGTGRASSRRGKIVEGQLIRVEELTSHLQPGTFVVDDRLREVVVLLPTKHPGTGPTTTPIINPELYDDERPLAVKHPNNLTPHPHPRERSSCTAVVRLLVTNDRPALTEHPTMRVNAWFTAIASTVSPPVHVITRSAHLVQPPPNGERPTLAKHPTAILGIAPIVLHTPVPFKRDWPRSFHFIGPRIAVQRPSSDRPALTKRPTGWLSVVAIVCMRVPRRVDRSLRSFGPNELPTVVQSTYNDGQPRSIEYSASEPSPPANDGSTALVTSTIPCSPKGDRTARTMHPTTRENALSFIMSPTPPSTSDLTRRPDVMQPLVLVDRPAAVKHPMTRQDTLPTPALSNVPLTHDDTRSALLVRPSANDDHPAAVKHPTVDIPVDSLPHPRSTSCRYNLTRTSPIDEFYPVEQPPHDDARPPATKHPTTPSQFHNVLVSFSPQLLVSLESGSRGLTSPASPPRRLRLSRPHAPRVPQPPNASRVPSPPCPPPHRVPLALPAFTPSRAPVPSPPLSRPRVGRAPSPSPCSLALCPLAVPLAFLAPPSSPRPPSRVSRTPSPSL